MLTTPSGLDRDIAAAVRADRLLVALDYDGTLAPFVQDPAAAVPDERAVSAVAALTNLPSTTVAIVTGRDREDLRAVAPVLTGGSTVIVDSHGANLAAPDPSAPTADRLVAELSEVARRFAGTRVEAKAHGAALHTRGLSAHLSDAALAAAETVGRSVRSGRVIRGNQVVELTSSSATKGDALTHLVDVLDPDAVVYIGDDTTDEDAFRALIGRAGAVTIKVGHGPTCAQHRLTDVGEVAALLGTLVVARETHAAS
ncbi:MAG: trehalose-phosphatase [Micropruina sp.]